MSVNFTQRFIAAFVLSLLLSSFSVAYAEDAISSGIDCTDIEIDYVDNPELTRAEKIALMEKAFYDSLNKFELCKLSSPSSNASSSNSGGQAGAESGNNAGGNAVANEELQGTESDIEPSETTSASTSTSETQAGETTSGTINSPSNGKTPEDIPPAANDDAIAAQIRLAAEAETDPEIRKKLWEEYRKYKGMNVEQ